MCRPLSGLFVVSLFSCSVGSDRSSSPAVTDRRGGGGGGSQSERRAEEGPGPGTDQAREHQRHRRKIKLKNGEQEE